MRSYDPRADLDAATAAAKQALETAPGSAMERVLEAMRLLGEGTGKSLRKARFQANKDAARRLIDRIDRGLETVENFRRELTCNRNAKILALAERVMARRTRALKAPEPQVENLLSGDHVFAMLGQLNRVAARAYGGRP